MTDFDKPHLAIIASAPSMELGHPRPVSAFSPAAPSLRRFLARVIEKNGVTVSDERLLAAVLRKN
jgi:hypothetical protein